MPGLNWLIELLRGKWTLPKDTRPSFTGKTVLVTGANVGLGLEAAVKFVHLGADKVILGVRTISKGENAKADIESRTGRKGIVDVWQLDMLDYDSIRAFATRANNDLAHLDIAVLNAGLMSSKFELTQYGWEKTLQVNTISTTLLGLLLLPKLKTSKRSDFLPILELVSSGNHAYVDVDLQHRNATSTLEAYSQNQGYSPFEQYNVSKLLLMFAQTGLVKAIRPAKDGHPPVEIVAVCPGATESELARDYDQYMAFAKVLFRLLVTKSAEEGARTYISGTTLAGKGHGQFWTADRIKEPATILTGAENEKLQSKVFEEIVSALQKEVPEVGTILRDFGQFHPPNS